MVIKPDDTVVIRIARSEMGQGTRTGLAQLVAEELQCDWSKVTTEYPTPGQNVARNRVWQNFSTGGSRGIREFERVCAQGRRGGPHDADCRRRRTSGTCRLSECRAAEQRHHPPTERTDDDLRQGRRGGRASSRRPRTCRSRTPKDWTIAGKPVKRLDTRGEDRTGRWSTAWTSSCPGMLVAAIKELPDCSTAR